MSTLSENVSLTITVDSLGLARAGFGVMLILSHAPTWTERTRTYEDIAGVATDFASNTATYAAANAAFAQSPHPEQIVIGRAANKPTQQYTIGAALIANSQAYSINVTEPGATPVNPVTYTSDASATAQEIHNGLVTALNAVTGKGYTATFAPLVYVSATFTASSVNDELTINAHGLNTGDGPLQVSNSGGALPTGLAAVTNYFVVKVDANNIQLATSLANALAGTFIDLTSNGSGTNTLVQQAGQLSPFLPFLVTGNAPGNWFSLEVTSFSLLSNKQTHADPGIAADLDAISLENPAWYALHTHSNSKAVVLAAASWIEAAGRLYLFDVVDTDAINVVVGSGTDTLAAINALTYNRTAGFFYQSPATMMTAALMGRVLPDTPGSETWINKTLAGVVPSNLNATHRTNLKARNASCYVTVVPGANKTQGGGVAGTFKWIDVTRGIDWILDDMPKRTYEAIAGPEKLPFDEQGIAVVRSEMKSSLKAAAANGILDANTIKVQTPQLGDVSGSDKANRILRNCKWSATLTGAIHVVVEIGSVTF